MRKEPGGVADSAPSSARRSCWWVPVPWGT